MIRVQVGAKPDDVRQSAKYILFVEGTSPDGTDPSIISELLRDTTVRVEPLGNSLHIRSAADALHTFHPNYLFLIDRDHLEDDIVEKSWAAFPDSNSSNLLIWRRRELENYFLIPEYLLQSDYIKSKKSKVESTIISCAQKRLFLDSANLVVIRLRERLKRKWISQFQGVTGFDTRQNAVSQLLTRAEFRDHQNHVAECLHNSYIEAALDEVVNDLTGGGDQLAWGKGSWQHMIKGKAILPEVVSTCFRVVDRAGGLIEGGDAVKEVCRNLLRKDMSRQPDDFRQLHEMIKALTAI